MSNPPPPPMPGGAPAVPPRPSVPGVPPIPGAPSAPVPPPSAAAPGMPPRPSVPGAPMPPPAPGVTVPITPVAPPAPGAPMPPQIPGATVPITPVVPPAPGTPDSTVPLRPAGLGGAPTLGGGLKTIALAGAGAPIALRAGGTAPSGPLAAGQPTAQLPKATIALTPTQPMSAMAPISSVQASVRNVADEEEEPASGLLLGLSIAALVAGLALLFVQIQTDGLENRESAGMTGGSSSSAEISE